MTRYFAGTEHRGQRATPARLLRRRRQPLAPLGGRQLIAQPLRHVAVRPAQAPVAHRRTNM